MASFVTHLEAAIDGTRLPADGVQTTHEGRPLWVRYDLAAIRGTVDRDELRRRPATPWRYLELLPFDGAPVTLGETATPLVEVPRVARELGLSHLLVKDESRLPTGSFKARGLAAAVTRARELGIAELAIPTAGNAGGALAAYAARAGLRAHVFMPGDTPLVNRAEAALHGARVVLVDGLITDCARVVTEGASRRGWFDCSTLKEPYRLEGKKTMGLELADQLGWRWPDVILYPTGGGTGLIGMSKAFDELAELGWLDETTRPRFHACQSTGCDPIAAAFRAGLAHAAPVEHPRTVASGIRVPRAVGDFMILDAVRRSGGTARSADDARLLPWMQRVGALEGLSICPETACCFAVLEDLVREGSVAAGDRVVVFNTAAAQKYVELIDVPLPRIADPDAVDWDALDRPPVE